MSEWSALRRRRFARTVVGAATILTVGVWASGALAGSKPQPTHPGKGTTNLADPRQDLGSPVDPASFAPGSCSAFAPTRGDLHTTVFLDAGHGGPDPGGRGVTEAGTAIHERELTLAVVMQASSSLRAKGYRVVVSRTNGGSVAALGPRDTSGGQFTLGGVHKDTAARPLCADEARAAVLVSVHFNIGSSPKNAGALTTYDAARTFAAKNHRLATLLQQSIVAAFHAEPDWNVPDDGVLTDDGVGNSLTREGTAYGHLLVLGPAKAGFFSTPSTMPGALVEPLFLTDPFEGSIAASTKGQQVIGGAVASAVDAFLRPAAATTG